MAETSGRLLTLLSLLQTPREWPGPELAQRLGVSQRTVRNDVERLRRLGYPVLATRGSVGGYRLSAGAAMPPLLLDDDEAVAIAVALGTASGGAVDGMEETALRALTKLLQVLPTRLGGRVDALQAHTVRVAGRRRGADVAGKLLAEIAAASRDREVLRFAYSDHSGSATERRVEPYKLVNWGQRWYLVAYDLGRDDWRTFRVDRMSETRGVGHRFRARELPAEDIAAYVASKTRQVQMKVSGQGDRARARVLRRGAHRLLDPGQHRAAGGGPVPRADRCPQPAGHRVLARACSTPTSRSRTHPSSRTPYA